MVQVVTEKVIVHNYYLRTSNEFYYANCIGNKNESELYLRSFAKELKYLGTRNIPEREINYKRGNKIIGRETFILSLKFVSNFGTNTKRGHSL